MRRKGDGGDCRLLHLGDTVRHCTLVSQNAMEKDITFDYVLNNVVGAAGKYQWSRFVNHMVGQRRCRQIFTPIVLQICLALVCFGVVSRNAKLPHIFLRIRPET